MDQRIHRAVSAVKHSFTTPSKYDYIIPLGVPALYTLLALVPTVKAQVGVEEASNLLCNAGGINVGLAITIFFGILFLWFFGKGCVRLMGGLDKTGSNNDTTVRQGKGQVKGAFKSMGAGIAPVFFVFAAETIGISVTSCVIPF